MDVIVNHNPITPSRLLFVLLLLWWGVWQCFYQALPAAVPQPGSPSRVARILFPDLIWFHLHLSWKYDKDIKMPSSQRCGLDFTHVICWYDRPWGNRSSRLSTFGVLSLICLRCCVHPIMYALQVPHPDSHRTPKRFVCFVQRSTRPWHCARHHGIGPGVSRCCSSWYHKCPPWGPMGSHGGFPWARLDICPIGDQVLRLSVWRHRARRKPQHQAASSSARPPWHSLTKIF